MIYFLHFVYACCLDGEKNIEPEKDLSWYKLFTSFVFLGLVSLFSFSLFPWGIRIYIFEYCVNCCIHTDGGPLKDKNYANQRAAEGSFVAWKVNFEGEEISKLIGEPNLLNFLPCIKGIVYKTFDPVINQYSFHCGRQSISA